MVQGPCESLCPLIESAQRLVRLWPMPFVCRRSLTPMIAMAGGSGRLLGKPGRNTWCILRVLVKRLLTLWTG
uniref:Uncharacterized protein n=1 Tax=Helianthus annuus TaxID=4232 RepID=A0A251RRG6_HELAN